MQSFRTVETIATTTAFMALTVFEVCLHIAVRSLVMRTYPTVAFETTQLPVAVQAQGLVQSLCNPLAADFNFACRDIFAHATYI